MTRSALATALLAVAVLPVLGLTACGGDDETAPVSQSSAAPSVPASLDTAGLPSIDPSALPESLKDVPVDKGDGKFCTFLADEQKRLEGLPKYSALTRFAIDLAKFTDNKADGKALQAESASCPGPAHKVLEATGLSSFSEL